MKKSLLSFLLGLVAFIGFIIFLAYFIYSSRQSSKVDPSLPDLPLNHPLACTLEAKICPDGSAVGRTEENCEFAPCPAIVKFPANYISAPDWPPQITLSTTTASLDCSLITETTSQSDRRSRRTLGSRIYCISAHSEGAAGSVYTDYIYQTINNEGRLVTAKFTLRYPQCLNYDEPRQSECIKERTEFKLDALIDQMIEAGKIN